jgi:chemotaxis protein CheY-P-specific phosphatase CheC
MATLNNEIKSVAGTTADSNKSVLEEILMKGYQRAASSFSTMIGSPVRIHNKNVDVVNDRTVIDTVLNERSHNTLIVTSIIGALKGESYFLLTTAEEQVICEMCRKAFGGASSIQNEMVLKEIDNIISAAVITEFSNALALRIYGDVPHLFHSSDQVLWNKAMKFEDGGDDYFIMANACFEFEGHAPVSPSFMWRFEKKILSLIQKPVIL